MSLTGVLLFAGGEHAHAATITVTTTTDELNADGDCSLREAIQAANTNTAVDACAAGSAADTITVPAGTYTLSNAGAAEDANATGDLDVTGSLAVNGPAAVSTIIDGADLDRVLQVLAGATVTLSGVTVQNGYPDYPGSDGGGIRNDGTLDLINSIVRDNSHAGGSGGGIFSSGTLTVTGSTITGNNTFGSAGGIHSLGSTLTLTNSAVVGNGAKIIGGGLYVSGSVTITNSTVSANAGGFGVGGIYGGAVIESSTISGNVQVLGGGTGPGGLHGLFTLKNTIVANNTGKDCEGTITSSGHNLIENTTDCTITGTTTGNILGVDPMLGPLANNGGPTKTHALIGGSPAIDAGSNDCPPPATDQRGVARPQGPACDIGAYEKQTKQAAPGDSDADGCTDEEENGTNPAMGGQRNYLSIWDIFDTDTENGPNAGTHLAGAVSVGDIVRVLMHFGQTGNAGIDPLSDASSMTTYHTRFDRTVLGPNQWNLGPPDGAVSVGDIVAMVNQYGHNCLAPP